MNKLFTEEGWEDYIYWIKENKKTLKRINSLLIDIERNEYKNGFEEGIGKPEPLKGNKQGYWSRRINQEDRLVYRIDGESIIIVACRNHYDDK